MINNELNNRENLTKLCDTVRDLIGKQDYQTCENIICQAMGSCPHAPQPHNLIGILLEITGDHPAAMKHFRAAWALDPTYLPARQNLESYGTFFSNGRCAFDENDCISNETINTHSVSEIKYDSQGTARRRN
ncbi:hypothetical protein RZO55_02775 [Clostridium boliviensis]|uniref:Tetratricopeptide repeat protein n=1 Tax=Clostridium boliviensis TaxID=318465 RepID=A0ABU4GFV1_9CLOT|nr:hypothetical protein [Clostridium boliviensis]MDW2796504.1 hypothetical protein [Clostridium boliviensis]